MHQPEKVRNILYTYLYCLQSADRMFCCGIRQREVLCAA